MAAIAPAIQPVDAHRQVIASLGHPKRQVIASPDRPKRQLRLFFPRETWALRTQFRIDALHFLYGAAEDELGKRLHSATVSAWSQPGEEDSDYLLLSVVADASRAELNPVSEGIILKICKEAENWTDEERNDYARHVYFELVPLTE